MEKWQVCGIFSLDTRPRLTLPNHQGIVRQTNLDVPDSGGSIILALLKSAGRKMAEFIALF